MKAYCPHALLHSDRTSEQKVSPACRQTQNTGKIISFYMRKSCMVNRSTAPCTSTHQPFHLQVRSPWHSIQQVSRLPPEPARMVQGREISLAPFRNQNSKPQRPSLWPGHYTKYSYTQCLQISYILFSSIKIISEIFHQKVSAAPIMLVRFSTQTQQYNLPGLTICPGGCLSRRSRPSRCFSTMLNPQSASVSVMVCAINRSSPER